jgi:hypothetical protein
VLRLLASGLLAAGVLLGSALPAQASPIVDKSDRHGDVKVHGSADAVDPAIISSVDLRHVTVTRQGHGVRVVIRLKEVLPSRGRYVQQIGFTLASDLEPGWLGSAPGSIFMAIVTPQHLGSAGAFYLDDLGGDGPEGEGGEEDEPLICHVAASKGARVVSIVVPDRCLPPDAGQLTVTSILFDKRSLDEADLVFIEDSLTVSGQVDLRP